MNTATEYKTVPVQFNKKGFSYRQVKREGHMAIYHQTRSGSELSLYEVVKIGRHNGYTMGGAYIEPSETYPGSSLWGICGWTFQTLEAAENKYDKLAVD